MKKCCWVLHCQSRQGNTIELVVPDPDGHDEEERRLLQRERKPLSKTRGGDAKNGERTCEMLVGPQ